MEFYAHGIQVAAEKGPVIVLFAGLTARLYEGTRGLHLHTYLDSAYTELRMYAATTQLDS